MIARNRRLPPETTAAPENEPQQRAWGDTDSVQGNSSVWDSLDTVLSVWPSLK